MSIPPGIRVAIMLVSPVACPHCGPVEIIADEERERPRICHPLADCGYHLHPDSPAALDLAAMADEEISRYAVLADYDPLGADLPVHAWGGA